MWGAQGMQSSGWGRAQEADRGNGGPASWIARLVTSAPTRLTRKARKVRRFAGMKVLGEVAGAIELAVGAPGILLCLSVFGALAFWACDPAVACCPWPPCGCRVWPSGTTGAECATAMRRVRPRDGTRATVMSSAWSTARQKSVAGSARRIRLGLVRPNSQAELGVLTWLCCPLGDLRGVSAGASAWCASSRAPGTIDRGTEGGLLVCRIVLMLCSTVASYACTGSTSRTSPGVRCRPSPACALGSRASASWACSRRGGTGRVGWGRGASCQAGAVGAVAGWHALRPAPRQSHGLGGVASCVTSTEQGLGVTSELGHTAGGPDRQWRVAGHAAQAAGSWAWVAARLAR